MVKLLTLPTHERIFFCVLLNILINLNFFRDRLEKEKKDLVAEAELERQNLVEAEARKLIAQEDVDRQRKIEYKIQKADARNATVRLRVGI